MTSIAHHLLGQTRSSVLSALFLHPDKTLHVRELRALTNLGRLPRQEVGRQVHYQVNPQCPMFAGLVGLADALRDALVTGR